MSYKSKILGTADGGTGASSSASGLNNLLPSQGGNNGKFLGTDGSNASWQTVAGGITGSGSAGQATFWSSGSAVSGDSNFFWDNTNKRLGVGTATPASDVDVVKNQNGHTFMAVRNSTAGAGAYTSFETVNDGGKLMATGIYSSTTTAYGAIGSGVGYVYSNSAQGMTLMTDVSNAPIVFAAGSTTEIFRITSTGARLKSATGINGTYEQASADFSNPMTDYFGANTYFAVQNAGALSSNFAHGGGFFGGVSDGTNQSGIILFGALSSTTPTQPGVSITAVKSDGSTGVTDLAAGEIAVTVGGLMATHLEVYGSGRTKFNARVNNAKGADVASANNLTLGEDGNYFVITGTTQVNLIDNAVWTAGSEFYLEFSGVVTVKHNQTTSGNNTKILVSGGSDYVSAAGSIARLVYNGTNFYLSPFYTP